MGTPGKAGHVPEHDQDKQRWANLVAAFLCSLAGNSLVLWLALASYQQQSSFVPLLIGDTINAGG